jgi:5-methyltetrahydrofolate--homocysteine methyltransferase
MDEMNELLGRIADNIYSGNNTAVAELTQQALDQGVSPDEVLNGGLVVGMDRVGVDFRSGELFVPEVLIAARAMHAGMDILRPLLAESDVPSAGKVVLGTVAGDLHDIGKNLVGMMLEGGGFEVIDIGVDAAPLKFVEAIEAESPDLLAMSALLTTTMPSMKHTIDTLVQKGVRENVKIMIGGAPVTQGYANQIGADGYAPDAASAVELARTLMK